MKVWWRGEGVGVGVPEGRRKEGGSIVSGLRLISSSGDIR